MKTPFLIALALFCVGNVQAQSAGSLLLQGGLTKIAPDVESGALSAPFPNDTRTDISSDTQPTAAVTYMLTDQWALSLPLATGFKHKLYGAGTGGNGVGQIGTVSALPVTLYAQFRFGDAKDKFRPYVMLGLTYAYFYDAKGSATLDALNPANPVGGHTGLKVDSKWALTPGLGFSYQVNERWFIDASYSVALLKTTTTLSTGQKIDTRLNPAAMQVGVGYRF